MLRKFNFEIMPEIKERWSPRAFDSQAISRDEIMAVLEAARFAPSCFNEQPWRFIIADEEESLQKMREALTPSNQEWANKAPVLILIASKKTFTLNGKGNFWHMFDAGTAWGYLSLEAQRRGLITHAMGGFNREKARVEFHIPEDYDIITVIAVGHYGQKDCLSGELQDREHPEDRVELRELIMDEGLHTNE
ncbi:nitroreductase family protein [Desulfosporosinus sp. SB140]|uniref:nitroreductase family protein n=1 Tax=Desulfosporosinus paludis TaxID=3115649 RepID=UPI00388D5BE3